MLFLILIPGFFAALAYNAPNGNNGLILQVFSVIVWILKFPSALFLQKNPGTAMLLTGAFLNAVFYSFLVEFIAMSFTRPKQPDERKQSADIPPK